MMGQVAKDCRLPDPGLAAHLDEKACVECRERRRQIHPAADKASNQPRAEENRRGAGANVRPFGARGLTDHGAARVADLQDIAPYRYLSDDPATHGSNRVTIKPTRSMIRRTPHTDLSGLIVRTGLAQSANVFLVGFPRITRRAADENPFAP
jgi:hypothetical protein